MIDQLSLALPSLAASFPFAILGVMNPSPSLTQLVDPPSGDRADEIAREATASPWRTTNVNTKRPSAAAVAFKCFGCGKLTEIVVPGGGYDWSHIEGGHPEGEPPTGRCDWVCEHCGADDMGSTWGPRPAPGSIAGCK